MAFLSPLLMPSRSGLRNMFQGSEPRNSSSRQGKIRSSGVSIRRSRIVCTASPISEPKKAEAEMLVDEILEGIKGTNYGAIVAPDERTRLDDIFQQLAVIGASQTPMEDPRLFGNYRVAYSSTKDKSPPAGGRLRGFVGQLLFPTRGLFQHLVAPDTVINMVCFRVLGILSGSVSLRGKLTPCDDSGFGPNGIRVRFDRPRLCFGKAVFEIGPITEVRVRTVYLDDRVRLAVGGRGSLFVFAKDGEAISDMAEEWKYVYQARPLPAPMLSIVPMALLALALLAPTYIRLAVLTLLTMFMLIIRRGGTAGGAGIVREGK